jgi:hypothetical protein
MGEPAGKERACPSAASPSWHQGAVTLPRPSSCTRGVGLSLIGLAATEVAEHRTENALRIAAAAEVYAQREGIAVIYSEDTPGREFVDQAHVALPADDAARATEAGRKLTIKEALDLARTPQTAPA